MNRLNTRYVRRIAFAGVIAALYAALTIALGGVAFGPVQFRVAEALCILPFFFPSSVWGIFLGCIIANMFSPYQLDIIVGPLASLIAALCTLRIGRTGKTSVSIKALACLPPVLVNAVVIGALIAFYMTGLGDSGAFLAAFYINCLQVGFGQLVVLYALGLPLMVYLPKLKVFTKLEELYT